LCEVTKRLPAAIVGRLLEIVRDERDLVQGDDETEAVRAALLRYGPMQFHASIPEDVFLTKCWLEWHPQAAHHPVAW
jgi:hypothetical protein